MEISVNIIKQGKQLLVAACDFDLLGRTLKFGEIDFEVSKNFYGGCKLSVEKAVDLMRQGTAVNMLGPIIVKKAIEKGLIHPKAVISISGIPHAQILKT
ncbi:MAG: DUF424 family protein [Candidatus Bathyarchaeota archaeon]